MITTLEVTQDIQRKNGRPKPQDLHQPGEIIDNELLAISEIFNNLVYKYTERTVQALVETPDFDDKEKTFEWINKQRDRQTKLDKTTQEEQQLVDQLTQIDDQSIVLTALFANPPSVFAPLPGHKLRQILNPDKFIITNPTSEEIAAAKNIENIAKKAEEKENKLSFFHLGVASIYRYLNYPRVTDGFTNHIEQRREWEKGVLKVLKLIDEAKFLVSDKDFDTSTTLASQFETRMNANKYAKGAIAKVHHSLQMLGSHYQTTNASDITGELSGMYKEFKQLGYDSFDDNAGINSDSKVSDIAIRTAKLVSDQSMVK